MIQHYDREGRPGVKGSFTYHLHWELKEKTGQLRLARVRQGGPYAGAVRLSARCAYVRLYASGNVGLAFEAMPRRSLGDKLLFLEPGRLPASWTSEGAKRTAFAEVERRFQAHLAAAALRGVAEDFLVQAARFCRSCPPEVTEWDKKMQARAAQRVKPGMSRESWVALMLEREQRGRR